MASTIHDQVVAVNNVEYLNTYKFWKRLEPRTRENNFKQSIQCRISDAMWMLTRQWQMGEFKAEDAGSPSKVSLQTERTSITHFKPKAFQVPRLTNPINENIPLEAIVEQEKLIIDVYMSIQMGLQFGKELAAAGVNHLVVKIIRREFALTPPTEEEKVSIDNETVNVLEAVAKPKNFAADLIPIDGKKIEDNNLLKADPQISSELQERLASELEEDGELDLDAELEKVLSALKSLYKWFSAVYFQPVSNEEISWNHNSFDYSCCMSAPKGIRDQYVLEITESPGGELDWYHFNILKDPAKKLNYQEDVKDKIISDEKREFVPVSVDFKGMPNSRWWAFEDAKIDFGNLDVKTTDLGKLLLMEFALIYGDDWYQIPIPLKIGSICNITSLIVQDVFGNTHNIKRAGSGENQSWDKWDMYSISYNKEEQIRQIEETKSFESADFLFLPPTLGYNEVSQHIEEVKFIRDETANKVWAIEHNIANGLGLPLSGFDYWKQRNAKIEENEIRENFIQLFSLYNIHMPSILQSIIDSAIIAEGIESLHDDVPEIDQLLSSISFLKRMIAEESGISYLNTIFLQTQYIDKRKKAFKTRIEGEEDTNVKMILKRFFNILELFLPAISDITQAFKKTRAEVTLESLHTYYETITEGLNKLIDPSYLTERQKELLGVTNNNDSKNSPIYKLISKVPNNWIPYIPVRVGSENRSIQLKQAQMLRSKEDGEPVVIKAQSRIMKSAEINVGHRINEEAVARHGLKIQMHMQRTRWVDGTNHLWTGRKVGPGRGEGSSGLKFDYLKTIA